MKINEISIRDFNRGMYRVLLVLEDGNQVSLRLGEHFEHEDIVENLLYAANDLVRKSRIQQTIPTSGN